MSVSLIRTALAQTAPTTDDDSMAAINSAEIAAR
jgi:hypothetical protein